MARSILTELGLEETKKPILGNIFRRGIEEAKKEAIRFPGRLLGIQQAPERLVQEPEKLARELSFGFPLIAGERALRTLAIQKALKESFRPSEILTKDRRYTEIPGVEEAMRRGLAGVAPFGLKGIAAKAPTTLMNVGAELAGILTLGVGAGILQEAIRGLRPEQLTLKATKQVGEKLLKQPSYQNLINRKAQQTGYATEDIHNATLREVSKQFQRKPYLGKLRVGLGERGFAGIRKGKPLPIIKAPEIIDYEDVVPTKALNILNRAFATLTTAEIPEKLYGKITLGELVNKFEDLGIGEEIIKESNIALQKAGYKKIGNILLTERDAIPGKPTKVPKVPLGKLVPPEKPLIKPSIELPKVTSQQKTEAHILARQKAMITPEGKTKPQYRRLAQGMTGKKSVKDMTREEANIFIGSLKSISEPYYKKGKLLPPSIPKTTALVKPEFFKMKFKKPTVAKLLTSQARYAELLGIKKLVAPVEIGKQNLDLEYARIAHQIDTATKELKKAKIAPEEMARMINTYEEVPPELSIQGKKVFNYFRDLTRDMIVRENEVRASLGLDPIPYRQAYLRHIADRMSEEIIQGKYPLPEGLKYWSQQTIGSKVYNPMEMQRRLRDDLLRKFSSDLPYVMKSMAWTGLKEIHLSIPKNILSKELGILSKDKAVYKNLTPKEQTLYDAQMTMPAPTKKWLLDYVNIVLGGRQTALDESVNLWVTDTPIKTVVNGILKPFGKHVGQKPITKMLSSISKLPIYGAMGGLNPRQLIRNKFQTIQNIALYGVKNTLKGYLPTSSYPVLNELKTDSLFKKSYSGFEDLPKELLGKMERIGLAPYQWTAISNVSQAMNSAYHWTAANIQNPNKKHLGWADPQRTYTENKNFFYPSEKAKLLKEMEYGAHTTQYQYIGLGMPEVFRYKALAPFTRLQSWWMNHWFVFHREAATRAFTGHTGYDPNIKLTLGDRINYLKYLILGGLILTNLGYYRSYLFGTAPTGLPPTAQLLMGLYTYATNLGDSPWEKRKRGEANYRVKQAALIHLPGYLSVKDTRAFLKGDKHWTEYLFYKKRAATQSSILKELGLGTRKRSILKELGL